MTNANFTKDAVFQKACEIAGVKATRRQASKFRNRKGAARRYLGTAAASVKRAQG
jgi:hypothetical protein